MKIYVNKAAKALAEKHECLRDVACGVDIGIGWFDLVDQLTTYIVDYCNATDLTPPVVVQVKQKFKGLRYYMGNHGFDPHISGLIRMAERMSFFICEFCGNKAVDPGSGTGSTSCQTCLSNNIGYWTSSMETIDG